MDKLIERIKAEASAAFGHQTNSLEDQLALRVMQIERHTHERNEALNKNAWQAQKIVQLEAELEAYRAAVAEGRG